MNRFSAQTVADIYEVARVRILLLFREGLSHLSGGGLFGQGLLISYIYAHEHCSISPIYIPALIIIEELVGVKRVLGGVWVCVVVLGVICKI